MEELGQVNQQDAATIKCPICSLNADDVHALELSQGIVPATTTTVDGSEEVEEEAEDETSTDLEATTEAAPAPEALPAPEAAPPPEAGSAPAPEAVPAPETAIALVIFITTITCLLVSMIIINLTC